jgi:hypothetical protein
MYIDAMRSGKELGVCVRASLLEELVMLARALPVPPLAFGGAIPKLADEDTAERTDDRDDGEDQRVTHRCLPP